MVVLISPETDVHDEIFILNQLFDAGLEYYHLRKPKKDCKEHHAYLNQIDEKYHDRIVIHFFHELINQFNLKGIHFQEQKKKR
jgi:thiamine-phosphate pyrophosphorylase